MALSDNEIKQILLGALDGFKQRVGQQTFSDKIVDGVAMMSMSITPARPGLPAGVLMLAISAKEAPINEIKEAFDSWQAPPKS